MLSITKRFKGDLQMMDIIISDGTAIRALQRYDWLTGFLSAVSIMAAGIGISRVMAKIEQSHPVIKRGFPIFC